MAHLKGDERGQLMLVGALSLAVLFVTFAFLLNTAIYTETIASRETGVEADTVVGYRNAAVNAAAGTIERLSVGRNASYDSMYRNFTAGMRRWDTASARHYATVGVVPSVVVMDVTNGTRIVQNETRNFTDVTGTTDWTLAEDVRVRNFTMTVEGDKLVSTDITDVLGGNDDGAFYVTFENVSRNYTLYVYKSDTDLELLAENSTGHEVGNCTRPSGPIKIDFAAGTVNGTDCDALDFYRTLDGEYDISFQNSDKISGTYSMTVSARYENLDESHFVPYGGDGPFRSTAIYAATLEVVYRSPSVYYQNVQVVAPGAAA